LPFIFLPFCGIIRPDRCRGILMNRFALLILFLSPMVALGAARDPRVAMSGATIGGAAPATERAAVASKNQISVQQNFSYGDGMSPSIKQEPAAVGIVAEEVKPGKKDNRDAERAACLANNIGVGNTFVWASRYSNTGSYATLMEDTQYPDNNVCFVRVDVRSNDSRIDTTGLPSKYFEWGRNIECGSWLDEQDLTNRILAAKKKGRTWATIGGAAGGAVVGVGSMELFGNRAIGGAVMGQKALQGTELLRSQMIVMKQNGDSRYSELRRYLQELQEACKDAADNPHCLEYNYEALLKI